MRTAYSPRAETGRRDTRSPCVRIRQVTQGRRSHLLEWKRDSAGSFLASAEIVRMTFVERGDDVVGSAACASADVATIAAATMGFATPVSRLNPAGSGYSSFPTTVESRNRRPRRPQGLLRPLVSRTSSSVRSGSMANDCSVAILIPAAECRSRESCARLLATRAATLSM